MLSDGNEDEMSKSQQMTDVRHEPVFGIQNNSRDIIFKTRWIIGLLIGRATTNDNFSYRLIYFTY